MLIVPLFCAAQDRVNDPDVKVPLTFSVCETEYAPGKYLLPGIDSNRFDVYGNDTLPNTRSAADRMVTLFSVINTASWPAGTPLAVFLPPFEYPANIYWNGSLVAIKGSAVGVYTDRTHFSKTVLITPSLLHPDHSNILTIQLYPKFGEMNKPFGTVFLSGLGVALREENLRNMYGPRFSFALFFTGLTLFAYYLVIHFYGQASNHNTYLLFALVNLASSLSQVNNAFSSDFSDVLSLERLSKMGYFFQILFSLLFVIEYTDLLKKKKIIAGILTVIFTAATAITVSQPTYIAMAQVYSYPAANVMQPALFLTIIILVWYAFNKRDMFSVLFLAVYAIDFACIYYDGWFYFVHHMKPFVNLMPYGFFLLNTFVLTMLAADQKRLKDNAVAGEQAVKKVNQELNEIVKSRTAQLNTMVNNLRQEVFVRTATQLKLDQAVSVKNKLFSIISHDLKNVFNSMISFTEFISEDIGNGRIGDLDADVKKLSLASKRAFFLLENLLEWSVTELNMAKVVPERIELTQILQESIGLFILPMEQKGLTVELDGTDRTDVQADRRMLQTILRNLISNAVKYSYENTVIRFGVKEEGDRVQITVQDTGKGLPNGEDILRKELLKSEQGTAMERGSGIGLYIVKEFLEQHHSTLMVESTPGKGSVFRFSLPKAEPK